MPSPLGRLLRQPVVPFSALADSPFSVIEDIDAGRAFVAAAERRLNEPVNVVAPGGDHRAPGHPAADGGCRGR